MIQFTQLASIQLDIPEDSIELMEYRDPAKLSSFPQSQRIAAGLLILCKTIDQENFILEKIDRPMLEEILALIDKKISRQLDLILHQRQFQELERAWSSIHYLVSQTSLKSNVHFELLEYSLEDAKEDFEDSSSVIQSGLFKHVYVDEYDMPGGEPYGVLIGDWMVDSSDSTLDVLSSVSKVAAAAHCPFLSGISPEFLRKKSMLEITRIEDLEHYLDRAEFLKWRSFRSTEDSRYIGLLLPQFLLRKPWDTRNDRNVPFHYLESYNESEKTGFLWGNAVYAFAGNMVKSFVDNGWCVQIRGPESGGKVADLPMHYYNAGRGLECMIPTEILIPETREFEFSRQGFIPLSYYKNRDYACFFSASSIQKPKEYSSHQSTANARINARLPYIFLSSRIAHYLKVIQRETIGAAKTADQLEKELNHWLKGLVTQMKNPGPELVASHPLHFAEVQVTPSQENPGFFSVQMTLVPHFQVEGVEVNLSLVSQMPQAKA